MPTRLFFAALCSLLLVPSAFASQRPSFKPNIVIVLVDDMGYGDSGCYGSRIATPHLDRLAKQGVRFTDFYVGQAVCSASRAALLTGCYPNRVGIQGALGPHAKIGLNTNEVNMARLLKAQGYATAIYGKWHLGDAPQFLPTHQGFDDYFGLPYSNDMWPYHPTSGTNYPPLPLISGDEVVQLMPDQTQLTTWYTERAVQFIRAHQNGPFFLYVAHNMPHVPLHVSRKFKDKSGLGLYADVIEEIDWSVGQIVRELQRDHLEERTLFMFTSDNGPWLLYGDHAGSAGPLREGKATCFDGGLREPCLMWWPGKIPPGYVCRELATTMDMLPTVAKLAGTAPPQDRIIDGKDIWPLITGEPGAKTPHEAFFYYWDKRLEAVRSGPWKLHFPHTYPKPSPPGKGGKPGVYATKEIGLSLFDLDHDIGETQNVADHYSEVVQRLSQLADRCRADLGDSATHQTGRNVRPAGKVAQPVP